MISIRDDNIFGVFASFQLGETNKELVTEYLWGEKGLKTQLMPLKWQAYGQDIHLILFEFHVNPIPYSRDNLKEIGSYRRKDKSIGIPVIIDQDNFFKLNEIDRLDFFRLTILSKLDLLKEMIKRNKLDLDLEKLKIDSDKLLQVKR